MRYRPHVCCVLVLGLAIAGCAAPSAPVPAVDQIASIRLKVMKAPVGAALKTPCEATLTKKADITAVIAWLEAIDWAQSGTDLKVVRIQQPDGEIDINAKDGTTANFRFYWDGKLIYTRANRLLRGGNMAQIEKIVRRVCE